MKKKKLLRYKHIYGYDNAFYDMKTNAAAIFTARDSEITWHDTPNILTGVRATTFEVYGLEATTEYEAMARKAKAAM